MQLSPLTKRISFSFAKFAKYDYQDALNFKSLLNEEEVMVMENANKFAQTVLFPRVLEDNRNESFDRSILKKMGESGYLGCTLSDFGMPGLSYTSYGLINR